MVTGKKDVQNVIDTRMEETSILFSSTEPEPQAVPEERDEQPKAKRKSRAWESRPENKVFGYRVGEELHTLILQAVDEYAAEGWLTTTSDVIKAWALAGRDLWLEGKVDVGGRAAKAGTRKRKRTDR